MKYSNAKFYGRQNELFRIILKYKLFRIILRMDKLYKVFKMKNIVLQSILVVLKAHEKTFPGVVVLAVMLEMLSELELCS